MASETRPCVPEHSFYDSEGARNTTAGLGRTRATSRPERMVVRVAARHGLHRLLKHPTTIYKISPWCSRDSTSCSGPRTSLRARSVDCLPGCLRNGKHCPGTHHPKFDALNSIRPSLRPWRLRIGSVPHEARLSAWCSIGEHHEAALPAVVTASPNSCAVPLRSKVKRQLKPSGSVPRCLLRYPTSRQGSTLAKGYYRAGIAQALKDTRSVRHRKRAVLC